MLLQRAQLILRALLGAPLLITVELRRVLRGHLVGGWCAPAPWGLGHGFQRAVTLHVWEGADRESLNNAHAEQALPGHAHMHPLLHYDYGIPALFSAPAEGTWISLRERDEMRSQLSLPTPDSGEAAPAAWRDMARQLTSAVLFLLEHTLVVHLDIKPDNVFFVFFDDARQRYHYWLGDFGICSVRGADKLCDANALAAGSLQYMPARPREWLHIGTLRALSLFQFFATLADMIHWPGFLSDGNPPPNVASRLAKKQPSVPQGPLRVCVDAVLHTPPNAMDARLTELRDALVTSLISSSRTPSRTGVCFDWGAVSDAGGVVAPHYLPQQEAEDSDDDDKYIAAGDVHQRTAERGDIAARLQLSEYLGEGSFGAAFLCGFADEDNDAAYVVKLPLDIVRDDAKALSRDLHLPMPIGDALRPPPRGVDGDTWRQGMQTAFKKECANAARFLEPECLWALRDEDGTAAVTFPIPNDLWRGLRREVRRWRALPGARFWHRIRHLDVSIPALLSERADGSLFTLQRDHPRLLAYTGRSGPSALWMRIVKQVADGLQFMIDHVPLVHLDIKPDNILYLLPPLTLDADGHPTRTEEQRMQWLTCRIGDYGICAPKGARIPELRGGHVHGTPGYVPPPIARRNGWFLGEPMCALALFQFAATAVNLLYGAGSSGGFILEDSGGSIASNLETLQRDLGRPRQRIDTWRAPVHTLCRMLKSAPDEQTRLFQRMQSELDDTPLPPRP